MKGCDDQGGSGGKIVRGEASVWSGAHLAYRVVVRILDGQEYASQARAIGPGDDATQCRRIRSLRHGQPGGKSQSNTNGLNQQTPAYVSRTVHLFPQNQNLFTFPRLVCFTSDERFLLPATSPPVGCVPYCISFGVQSSPLSFHPCGAI